MRVLLVFVDGFGLGPADPTVNPLVRFPGKFFPAYIGGPLSLESNITGAGEVCLVPLDACLGVEGLPQSATGQTALFTGVNAPKAVGHHVQAFPGPQLAKLIATYGIMRRLKEKGCHVTSANMYTPNYMELVAARKRRHSASSLLILAAGETFRSIPELTDGKAVYQDITNAMLPEFGFEVDPVTPSEAGRRLASIAAEHDFTLFEYFQTDRCGHKQDWQRAAEILYVLDEFFLAICSELPKDVLFILTSDHGNFEDMNVRTHTLNPVPGLFIGAGATDAGRKCKDLTDIAKVIENCIERGVANG